MGTYLEVVVILACAVGLVWLFRKLNMPAILAYLVAGMLVGEHGLNFTHNNVDLEHFAELGIVFLLFTLGLEFSLPKLMAMRRLVFAVGSAQVAISMLLFTSIAMLLGQSFSSAFVIGGVLALSSTAIVIRQLSETGAMKRKSGQLSVAILLFQDIAVVPLLIIIPLLAQPSESSMVLALAVALVKGVFVVGLLMLVGKWILPRIYNLVAQVRTDELFVLTTLLVTLVASSLTLWFGLSMALGAFLAGMMLGESQYKYQLEADIRPYRDILLGLFFVTVGMKFDVSYLLNNPIDMLVLLVCFMLCKVAIIYYLAKRAGENAKDGLASGIMLCQMGEFGFVLIALARQVDVIPVDIASILIGVGVISMAMTPYLIENARNWSLTLTKEKKESYAELQELPQNTELEDHVIICGFGRVGQTISRFLKQEGMDFVAIDIDPLRTTKAREAGENILFGSSRQTELLHAAKIDKAKLVVITFGEDKQSADAIQRVRALSPEVPILVRTRNDDQLEMLKSAGANEVVPEMLEGSLMLVSQVLSLSGVSFSRVVRLMQKERKSHYNHMHGFFQGEQTDMSQNVIEQREFAHGITLTENSYAVGKSIGELNFGSKRIDILTLRQGEEEIDLPDESIVLQNQDTLVIRGKPRRVEWAEHFIHEGE
ncbi:cation:proton antiporter [Thalassotalea sp. LPB0316]|uniref:monovalent cation:proton antiporter family protein n=1 Tax=Thalassotalea sp. LPB0316 TaxID=2769490 RepID=UPI001868CDD9|nr:monovalent cation:proton antiporter family protein [Thalassotalea sp. LPB0316]QOL24702.1 cation:proton antiporter [Thalassotalea sp. LPB0316]